MPSPTRSWTSLAGSTAIHALLLLLALSLSRRPLPDEERRDDGPREPSRQVDLVYLAPPPQPPPPPPTPPPPATPPETPPPKPVSPAPPPKTQPIPEPRANAPPDAIRSEGTEEPDEGGSAAEAPRPEPSEAAPTMESEARRIFGTPRLSTRPGAGPRVTRPMEAYRPDRADDCVPRPSPPRDSGVASQFGTVVGRIFRQDDGRPLAGAHLQMLGTPYVAFTDGDGEYRFRFDMSLVENCRTQYVRVTARGYESRLLVLVVGPNSRSEDVLLRRR